METVHECVCVRVLMHACVCVSIMHVCAYLCVCVFMHFRAYLCICVFMHACDLCLCVCTCACVLLIGLSSSYNSGSNKLPMLLLHHVIKHYYAQ